MAYYNKLPPKSLTRGDHLRKDAKEWVKDEGSEYRRGRGADPSRTEGSRPSAFRDRHPARTPEGASARPVRDSASGRPARESSRPHPADRTRLSPRPEHTSASQAEPYGHGDGPSRPSEPENLIVGRNPIREALRSGRDIEKLLVAKGDLNGTAREIVAEAREQHIPVQTVERSRLDEICRNHQGMLAFASAYRYYEVEDMLEDAARRGEKPFLVILDGVTDPQNLGAIIRTAACVGAHGVIVPQRRAVGLTPSAVKASAGAIEKIKVARVTNLARTLDMLKEKGLWLYAADMNGVHYRKVDFSGAVGLVIGSEGDGISRLTLEKCDYRVSLPMTGAIDSLNASVAAGILMYAVRDFR
ncbi:MAG: 23S rRNA (guanosine(2251)-2'-O)-methyltransferase RlmB [Clostridia bacterium]|nr:23S rRNA (guanosine(2251)-2'-O)-methyltransferase RlmB [Clostridia bacterium]